MLMNPGEVKRWYIKYRQAKGCLKHNREDVRAKIDYD
jgi:hypothetical protein